MRTHALCLLILLLVAPLAGAATFSVDDSGVQDDASPGDGACATAAGTCTLQAALMETEALDGPDEIRLAVELGRFDGFAPPIRGGLTISGPGTLEYVYDWFTHRTLSLQSGADVTFSDLTLVMPLTVAEGARLELLRCTLATRTYEPYWPAFQTRGDVVIAPLMVPAGLAATGPLIWAARGTLLVEGGSARLGCNASLGIDMAPLLQCSDANVTLRGVSVHRDPHPEAGGYCPADKGSVSIWSGRLTLENCDFSGITSGLFLAGGTTTVVDSSFHDMEGDAIVTSADLTMTRCTLGPGDSYTNFAGRAAGCTGLRVRGGHARLLQTTVTDWYILDQWMTRPVTGSVRGAGVRVEAGRLDLTDSVIERCTATASDWASGGGLYIRDGSVRLERSLVTGNSACDGGAIHVDGGSLELVESRVTGNEADRCVDHEEFSDDHDNVHHGGRGGALLVTAGSVRVERSLLRNNVASRGGALHAEGGSVTFVNSTLTGNRALLVTDANNPNDPSDDTTFGGEGGALGVSGGTVEIWSSTLASNTATVVGHGLHVEAQGSLSLADSIVHGDGPECAGTVTSLGHVLIGDVTDCDVVGDTATLLQGIDPLLLPLADNGGATGTMALALASPARDAAHPGGNRGPGRVLLDRDQRGAFRVSDGDGDGVARGDLGPYEACDAAVSGDADGDGLGDECDVEPTRRPGGLRLHREGAARLVLEWNMDAGARGEVCTGDLSALRAGVRQCEAVACDLDSPRHELDLPAPSTFWLVGARVGDHRTGFGEDSFGTPMPVVSPCP